MINLKMGDDVYYRVVLYEFLVYVENFEDFNDFRGKFLNGLVYLSPYFQYFQQ